MGYSIYSTENSVRIPQEHAQKAFEASRRWFRDEDYTEEVACLDDIAMFFGYRATYDPVRFSIDVAYEGEKYDESALGFLESIAEYIEDGSYIEFVGEQGDNWRWVIKGGHAKEITSVKTWDDAAVSVDSFEDAKNKLTKLYMNGDVVLDELFATLKVVGLTIEENVELAECLRKEVDGDASVNGANQVSYNELLNMK